MSEAKTIAHYEGVALIKDCGGQRFTVLGARDLLTLDLARALLTGTLRQTHAEPFRLTCLAEHASEGEWSLYHFALEGDMGATFVAETPCYRPNGFPR